MHFFIELFSSIPSLFVYLSIDLQFTYLPRYSFFKSNNIFFYNSYFLFICLFIIFFTAIHHSITFIALLLADQPLLKAPADASRRTSSLTEIDAAFARKNDLVPASFRAPAVSLLSRS